MNDLSKIIEVKTQAEAELLGLPSVTGVDVGYKYVGGERTDEIAIRVHVEKKKKRVAADAKVPEEIGGYKTDVLEHVFELHQEPTNKLKVDDVELMADTNTYDPVKGGISIGPCRIIGGYVFTGTLGAIVKDNQTGDPLLLSNFHVMCVDNTWSTGDLMAQPSRVDTGSCPADRVGALHRAALTATVDGAVCTLTGREYKCEIVDIGAVAGINNASMDMPLRKRGRTTGLTYGFVDSLSLTVNIDYGDGIGNRILSNQIGIRPDTSKNASFGQKGDSGSVIVDDNEKIVGLYFAGSPDGFGVANHIDEVLSALDIKVCTGGFKSIVKDYKDNKHEFKELKNELKEFKNEKNELKDRLKHEKWELKDHKPEKFEYEVGKNFSREVIDPIDPGPIDPGLIDPGPLVPGPISPRPIGFDERLRKLEAAFEQMRLFVTAEKRPNLNVGALSRESDLSEEDLVAISQKLQQDTLRAMQQKVDLDNKPADR